MAPLAITRTEALAPLLLLLLQVGDRPKKIPDQPKARKGGK